MKTADQHLEENGVRIFGSQRTRIEESMKAYAKSALEEAANKATIGYDYLPSKDDVQAYVNRDSILNIIKDLK